MLSDGQLVTHGKSAEVLTTERLKSVFGLDLDVEKNRMEAHQGFIIDLLTTLEHAG